MQRIKIKSYARIGLLGNPSDGFFGKTISCSINNFHAEVILKPSKKLKIVPNKKHDPLEFNNLKNLFNTANQDGYYGGIRLIYATCKKFQEYFNKNFRKNFTVSYSTNIPRQVGLGGSSAIIGALTKALLKFYNQKIPKKILPNFLLDIEKQELGISAGLQDRVIQVYGKTVFMDFDKNLIQKRGYGDYEYLDSKLLPELFLAYIKNPTCESGKMHNPIRYKFEQGDKQVISAMQNFANYAEQGKQALLKKDYKKFGQLINKNFDLRRALYGDKAIGKQNLELIKIARQNNCPAKFCGSGGAVFGIINKNFEKLKKQYLDSNFECVKIKL